ncbi:hypothetical protein PAHAL_4G192500 [Panicum hallii]|uniref:Uncharacterized protein n=1 Tax=Panicum hallii TaxID=206008 RepID=A0A2S3HJ81_9POAL|nr:hypothetical protein PAHAL_4G192500 [Panicum hallii]
MFVKNSPILLFLSAGSTIYPMPLAFQSVAIPSDFSVCLHGEGYAARKHNRLMVWCTYVPSLHSCSIMLMWIPVHTVCSFFKYGHLFGCAYSMVIA